MKRIILFVVSILFVFSLCSCSHDTVDIESCQKTSSMFVMIEDTGIWNIVYHKDTMVMYVVSRGSYNQGTFTLMVNPDGTPMLYQK